MSDDYEYGTMNNLVGKRILSVAIVGDELHFTPNDGPVIKYRTEADCLCAHTWWESIDNEDALDNAVVISTENCDMPEEPEDPGEPEDPDDYTVIKYYGVKIHTDKGDCTIDFRNSSNGYYGGSYALIS